MTTGEQLKAIMLKQYGSVRAFTKAAGIPYSTISSMLLKGAGGTGLQTAIKVCSLLNLDVESLAEDKIKEKSPAPECAEDNHVSEALYSSLIASGVIKGGEDITDSQVVLLSAVANILCIAFDKTDQ